MREKHILLVCGVFYPEPVVSANLMTDLAKELAKSYRVTVLRPAPTRPMGFQMPEPRYEHLPFEVVTLDSYTCPASRIIGRFRESISMGQKACAYIDEHRKDIDLIFDIPWHLFGRQMVAKKALMYGIPFVTAVQDIYPESLTSKLPKIGILQWAVNTALMPVDLYCLRNARFIHTNSEKMKHDLIASRHLPEEKFVVVRNWQNEADFVAYAETAKEQSHEGMPFTFMYLGNVGPLAGIETLFEALRLAALPHARLVIAGSGPAKADLQEKAKQYADCAIEFWDVPAGMVPATQAQADVMCLPVKKGYAMSSVPSKLPAYMFSAKPVLAAVDAGSDTAECIEGSRGGWVAAPEDPASIAACMREAYATDGERLRLIGQRGFDYAIGRFSRGVNLPILVNACIQAIETI